MKYLNIIGTGEQQAEFAARIGTPADNLYERAEILLDMFPDGKADVVLFDSAKGVQEKFAELHNKQTDYIAFTSRTKRTIFISVADASIRVFAHEIAHAIIHRYFTEPMPVKWHEFMAQFVEKHILD